MAEIEQEELNRLLEIERQHTALQEEHAKLKGDHETLKSDYINLSKGQQDKLYNKPDEFDEYCNKRWGNKK